VVAFRGLGDGQLAPPTTVVSFPNLEGGEALAVGDLDEDGLDDIAFGLPAGGFMTYLSSL
jgi:hypothetical protein